jgi:hypothetical protein
LRFQASPGRKFMRPLSLPVTGNIHLISAKGKQK